MHKMHIMQKMHKMEKEVVHSSSHNFFSGKIIRIREEINQVQPPTDVGIWTASVVSSGPDVTLDRFSPTADLKHQ